MTQPWGLWGSCMPYEKRATTFCVLEIASMQRWCVYPLAGVHPRPAKSACHGMHACHFAKKQSGVL